MSRMYTRQRLNSIVFGVNDCAVADGIADIKMVVKAIGIHDIKHG
jgi:hypothetical protein